MKLDHRELIETTRLLEEREEVCRSLGESARRDPIWKWACRRLEAEGIEVPRPPEPVAPPGPSREPCPPRAGWRGGPRLVFEGADGPFAMTGGKT